MLLHDTLETCFWNTLPLTVKWGWVGLGRYDKILWTRTICYALLGYETFSHLHTDMTPCYQILDIGTGTFCYTSYEIFSCTCAPAWCHAIRSSPVLAHRDDATLSDLLLAVGCGWSGVGVVPSFGSWHRNYFLCTARTFSCTCTPIWCHAVNSSPALAHRDDATRSDLLLALACGWGGVGVRVDKLLMIMLMVVMMVMITQAFLETTRETSPCARDISAHERKEF